MSTNTGLPVLDVEQDTESTAPDAFFSSVKNFFPFPEIRPQQDRALQAIDNGYKKSKRVMLLELPTGSGKSPICFAAAKHASYLRRTEDYDPGAYILTVSKLLTQQYMRDFADMGLAEMRGQANYPCVGLNIPVEDGGCSIGSQLHDGPCGMCPYRSAKEQFCHSKYGVTNFAYFINETRHVGNLKPRRCLLIDECHNTEKEILNFADIQLTTRRAQEVGVDKLPFFDLNENKEAKDWLWNTFLPAADEFRERMEAETREARYSGDRDAAIRLIRKSEGFNRFYSKLLQFVESPNLADWVVYTEEKNGALVIKPLTASLFAEEILFSKGERIIMTSATILDPRTFARNLGLSSDQCGFLRLESDFPVENRPIRFIPVGSMSWKNIDETIPVLLKYIAKILQKHPTEKGIIHCQSYKLQKAIIDYFYGTPEFKRLIYIDAGANSVDRENMLYSHINSDQPTVLLSPALVEGIDLKDDLSRWQIIPKVPYPPCNDPYMKVRMQRDPKWYTWQTALKLVQATGRSIRSKEDRAVTYILDRDFDSFLTRAGNILPDWWKKAIVQR
jgi:Rad3-related DNA helicase